MKAPGSAAAAVEISLHELPDAFTTLLQGAARGRFVVRLS
jgi:hypothetical protein